jgi:asparagine synthase (glutamine-hydrolysing)
LSGDGGDELFGGYGRYFNTVDEWQRKRNGDRNLGWWQAGSVYLSNRILVFPDDEIAHLMGGVPPQLAQQLGELRDRIDSDHRPLINVLRELDAETYMPGAVLPKVDRMSMQHSLEVRAPLLGIDVARFAASLAADDCYSAGQGKLVLKRVAERYLPTEWMRRPKRGFGLPMDMWGVDTLMPALKGLLLDQACRIAEWAGPKRVSAYVQRLQREFHPYRAWALFVLESWLRTHPAKPAVG